MRDTRCIHNILVTGGAGFIGSAFIRFLLEKKNFEGNVINLDLLTYAGNEENLSSIQGRANYHFVQGDICDEKLLTELFTRHEIDTVVHFAAESHVDRSISSPMEFVRTNVMGTFTLLEVARRFSEIHFHHVSTDEVYGSLGSEGYFLETTPYQPSSPYSASKASSDHFVRAYANTYKLSTTLSNCSNNYGPYQHPEKLIPLMIQQCFENNPLPIYGNGLNVRDWLFVDDHVEAIWTILLKGQSGETYNIGGSCERNNLDVVKSIVQSVCEQTGENPSEKEKLISFVEDRKGHDFRYAIDSSKIQQDLGWSPRHNFTEGLRETVLWYLERFQQKISLS